MSPSQRSGLPGGIYVPIPTFFQSNEDLDLETLQKHIKFLCSAGVNGIIFQGSTGEAVHLSDEERIEIIRTGVKVMQQTKPDCIPVAGCGIGSARGTIKLCRDAAEAGAQYALVLPPSYFQNRMSQAAIQAFFEKVADESPIPIIIYNYPGVSQGIDISVQTLSILAEHRNIVGIKGTDGNIGKVGYLSQHTNANEFTLLAGSADFFLPALSVGAVGCVPGLANMLPRACIELLRLHREGKYQEATHLQQQLVIADDAMCRWYGLSGLKGAMDMFLGYGGILRNPLIECTMEEKKIIAQAMQNAASIEQNLA